MKLKVTRCIYIREGFIHIYMCACERGKDAWDFGSFELAAENYFVERDVLNLRLQRQRERETRNFVTSNEIHSGLCVRALMF